MDTVAIIGVGVMGETVLAGLLAGGHDPQAVIATARTLERAQEVKERYGVEVADNAEAAGRADVVFVAVKPYDVPDVLREIAGVVRPQTVVVSLAAGVTTDVLEALLPAGTPVIRTMPNTPARVSEGMTALCAGHAATPEHLLRAADLLRAVGQVVTVPEKYLDAVTAISGSGPAYLFFVVESMIDAGVLLGLPRDVATRLVVQTMFGSAKLLSESGEHPTVLRENVTSPGGTTAAALRAFEDNKVRAAFISAMEACRDRSAAIATAVRDAALAE